MPFSDYSIAYQNETTKRTRVRARFYEGEWVEGDDGPQPERTMLESRTVDFPPNTSDEAIAARLVEILATLSPFPLVSNGPG